MLAVCGTSLQDVEGRGSQLVRRYIRAVEAIQHFSAGAGGARINPPQAAGCLAESACTVVTWQHGRKRLTKRT